MKILTIWLVHFALVLSYTSASYVANGSEDSIISNVSSPYTAILTRHLKAKDSNKVVITVERYKDVAKDPTGADDNIKQGGTLSKYSVTKNGTEVAKGYMLEAASPDSKTAGSDQRIPIGKYYIIKNPGSKGDFRLVLLDKTAASNQMGTRSLVNIHIGNFPKDIEGCLVPGTSATETPYPKVNSSKVAYDKIKELIEATTTEKKTTYDGANTYTDSTLYNATIVIK